MAFVKKQRVLEVDNDSSDSDKCTVRRRHAGTRHRRCCQRPSSKVNRHTQVVVKASQTVGAKSMEATAGDSRTADQLYLPCYHWGVSTSKEKELIGQKDCKRIVSLYLLKVEFLYAPELDVVQVFEHSQSFTEAYIKIDKQIETGQIPWNTDKAIVRHNIRDTPWCGKHACDNSLVVDLMAAQVECERRRVDRQKKTVETEETRRSGLLRDCGCCFTEHSAIKMACCSTSKEHFFCWECTKKHAELEFSQGNYRPRCMDTSQCWNEFPEETLRQALEPKTFERLKHLRSQQDIRAKYSIQELDMCPFCGYAEVRSSIADRRTFSCRERDCGKIVCRLCKHLDHTPLSCAQMLRRVALETERRIHRQNKQDSLHAVEEAMSNALVRHCNECKTPFVKEGNDCNKITCVRCKNKQCYNCGENVLGYEHFGVDKCQLFDVSSTDWRHREEIQKARDNAVHAVRVQQPEIRARDIYITVLETEQPRAASDQKGKMYPAVPTGLDEVMEDALDLEDARSQPDMSFIGRTAHIPIWRQLPGLYQANLGVDFPHLSETQISALLPFNQDRTQSQEFITPTPLATAMFISGFGLPPEPKRSGQSFPYMPVASALVNGRHLEALPLELHPQIWG